jgi:hypothetical protein
MSKSKNSKPDEHLLGTIRAQKKQIKRYQAEIKRLEKLLGFRQNKTEKEDKPLELLIPDCPECKFGYLKEIIVVGRKIKSCGNCDYRTKAVKI